MTHLDTDAQVTGRRAASRRCTAPCSGEEKMHHRRRVTGAHKACEQSVSQLLVSDRGCVVGQHAYLPQYPAQSPDLSSAAA
jgi:hypothetical protein